MSFPVTCFCGYMCNRALSWRHEDFGSFRWIKALKGEEVNGYSWIPVNGIQKRLSNANLTVAIEWFGEIAAHHLETEDLEGPFLIVPVPNSSCIVSSTARPQTRKLARAISQALPDDSGVVDCLRWRKHLGSASKEGGPRDAETLYRNLTVSEAQLDGIDRDVPVLLVDDVTTSGGHLRASVARLQAKGLATKIALCGGKTVYDQTKAAFHVYENTLEDYEP